MSHLRKNFWKSETDDSLLTFIKNNVFQSYTLAGHVRSHTVEGEDTILPLFDLIPD